VARPAPVPAQRTAAGPRPAAVRSDAYSL